LGTTEFIQPRSLWTKLSISLIGVAFLSLASTLGAQEIILFPALSTTHSIGGSAPKTTDNSVAGSLFASHDFGSLRFLGEVLFSNKEREIERAQIGWKLSSESTLWLGRFHTPLGYWNTEYHHGAYLQATIAKPQIANYEDERGLLALHGMGVLLQAKHNVGEGSFLIESSLASGPTVNKEGLEPIPVLRKQHYGKTGGTVKLAWQPNVTSNTQFGASLGKFSFPFEGAPADSIAQTVVNGFVNFEAQNWRVLAELYVTRQSAIEGGLKNRGTLTSTYVQTEYRINEGVLGYLRLESLSAAIGDPLVNRNLTLARRAGVLGARFEISKRLAFKVEASSRHLFDSTTSQTIAAQISGAFQ
jgi:hypothetical protein